MRKAIVVFILSLTFVPALFAQVELKAYGFIKGDMVYATQGVKSFGNENLSASQLATGRDTSALGFTAQHTRLGLKGSTGEKIKVGGVLELDFYGGRFDANTNPRLRLAYASIAVRDFEARFGQQWDLFSPNNPMTNNTNGNLWYAGNLGFRRTQIQLIHKMKFEKIAPMLQLSFGEASREFAKIVLDTTIVPYELKDSPQLGADNFARFPMIQGRLSSKFMDKYVIGVYFVYAKFDPNPDFDDDEYNTSGFGFDFDLPFSALFTLKGEVNTGTNLFNANLFTNAGSGSANNDRKSMSFWFNAISKPSSSVNFVLGYGMDKNQTDNLAANKDIEQNSTIYGDIIFPFGNGFSIALEAQNISTKIKGRDTHSALVFDVAGILSF